MSVSDECLSKHNKMHWKFFETNSFLFFKNFLGSLSDIILLK